MSVSTGPRPVTKVDFEQMPDAFKRYEVDRGRLLEVEPVGNLESMIAARIAHRLFQHLGTPSSSEIMVSDARFGLARNPDVIRGCDVSYVPNQRMPGGRPESGVGDYAPALAVEIVSPTNTTANVTQKIDDWFSGGVELLWVIYPQQQRAYAYRSPTACEILDVDQALGGGDVLPGLRIPLRELFV